jgi:putative cardiolipin synthase
VARYGNYSLHAKLYVFDRKSFFIGSMNFDQRSYRINTEIGLLIESPSLAEQIARRFDAMVDPQASYRLALRPGKGKHPSIVWRTIIDGRQVEFDREPARSDWQRTANHLLALFPIRREL